MIEAEGLETAARERTRDQRTEGERGRERIIVIGAGIAGLGSALALARAGRSVTVIDRDPPPPEGDPDRIFDIWARKGVSQLRHSHAFLARLTEMLRTRHPALLDALMKAGARPITFEDHVPPPLKAAYRPQKGDEVLTILTCRRTTLEYVMRTYAAAQPGVVFRDATLVRAPILDRSGPIPRLVGIEVEGAQGRERLDADIVIDAGGRNSLMVDWLAEAGITPEVEMANAGILYYTRHYRLKAGEGEPPRGGAPGAGDLGYIKFGVFPADHGCFSITLAVPEIEMDLRRTLPDPAVFDRICTAIPGTARWLAVAEPVSKVFGMGNLKSQWRHFAPKGQPRILGYFPAGDSHVRTNPLYGRGCSFSFIQAEILADILGEVADPGARLVAYEKRVRRDVRPFYDAMVRQDGQAIRRALREREPGHKPRLRARFAQYMAEKVLAPAIRGDMRVFRAFLRGFNMIDMPSQFTADPLVVLALIRFALRGPKRNAPFMPPKLGPDRREMFTELGLNAA